MPLEEVTQRGRRRDPAGGWAPPAALFCSHLVLVTAIAVAFYVYVRAFPLFGEDGAFNYMSMLQRLDSGDPLSLLFGYKLVEGLGQPNPFLTIAFDPFSWPLLTLEFVKHSTRGALLVFQLTMALRVIVCWLGTYVFAAWAFPGTRTVALTASYLNILLTFFLSMNIGSTELYGAMYNGTQAALLPLAAGVYLRGIVLGKSVLSANSLLVLVTIFFLIMSYPIGSMVTAGVLIALAGTVAIAGGAGRRRRGTIHFAGLVAATAFVLFLPGIDPYASWQSVARVSSRVVFADELKPYFVSYSPPTFWFTPPFAARLMVLCAVAGLLVIDRITPLARAAIAALALIVLGIQALYLTSSWGIFGDIMRPLPPLTRIERQLTPLYSFAAAIALYSAERLLLVPSKRSFLLWTAAAIAVAVAAVYMFSTVYDGPLADWGLARSLASEILLALVASLLVLAFILNFLRLFLPETLPAALRGTAIPFIGDGWCARHLRGAIPFAFIALISLLAVNIWVTRPYFIAADATRDLLCDHVTLLGCRDSDFGRSVYAGTNPIVDFLRDRLASSDVFSGRAEYLSAYDASQPSAYNVVSEEDRNFRESGSGFMLSALSFHRIPVPSAYEQSNDYLYYLFWTRYITQNAQVRFSPNFTALFQFLPGPLELAGVRYVVTRRENGRALGDIPVVLAWKDFVVAELEDANTRGYAARHVVSVATLGDAFSLMRRSEFAPRTEAVLLETDRRLIPEGGLQPIEESVIATRQGTVHLSARSAGKASLIVLPFRFSHCWRPEWNGPQGTLIRADVALLAVYFKGAVDVKLKWMGGYGAYARCLDEDAALIAEARDAARDIPY